MQHRTSTVLLLPWSLIAMLLLIFFCLIIPDELKDNEWIMLLFILPTAIMENLKAGYSTIKVMFYKLIFTMLTFMVAGLAGGSAIYHYYLQQNNKCILSAIDIPPHVVLTIGIILLIDIANTFTLLKAVKREFGSFEAD